MDLQDLTVYEIKNLKKPTVANNIAAFNGPFGMVTKLDPRTYKNIATKRPKTVVVEKVSQIEKEKKSNYGMEHPSQQASQVSTTAYPQFYKYAKKTQITRKGILHQRSASNNSFNNSQRNTSRSSRGHLEIARTTLTHIEEQIKSPGNKNIHPEVVKQPYYVDRNPLLSENKTRLRPKSSIVNCKIKRNLV